MAQMCKYIIARVNALGRVHYQCTMIEQWFRGHTAWEFHQLLSTTVPDPCLSQPGACDINADCEREGLLSDNFTCTCRPPFIIGDGFNCASEVL